MLFDAKLVIPTWKRVIKHENWKSVVLRKKGYQTQKTWFSSQQNCCPPRQTCYPPRTTCYRGWKRVIQRKKVLSNQKTHYPKRKTCCPTQKQVIKSNETTCYPMQKSYQTLKCILSSLFLKCVLLAPVCHFVNKLFSFCPFLSYFWPFWCPFCLFCLLRPCPLRVWGREETKRTVACTPCGQQNFKPQKVVNRIEYKIFEEQHKKIYFQVS